LVIYEKWYDLYQEAEKLPVAEIKGEIACIGMGGSGVTCEVLKAFRELETLRHADTVIAVSYSGETAETLLQVKESLRQGKRVIAVTSGGTLSRLCKEVVKVPGGLQPRFAFPLLIHPVLRMTVQGDLSELKEAVKDIRGMREQSSSLANEMFTKIPVFYASKYLGVAKRFKQEINENAKYPAFFGEIPEVHHNEVESYVHGKNLYPVVIEGDKVDEITSSLLKARAFKVTRPLYDVSYLIALAGFLSVELARMNGEDPERLRVIPKARERSKETLLKNKCLLSFQPDSY